MEFELLNIAKKIFTADDTATISTQPHVYFYQNTTFGKMYIISLWILVQPELMLDR